MTAPDDRAANVEPSGKHPRQGGTPQGDELHETESRLDDHPDLLTPENVRRHHAKSSNDDDKSA